MSLRLAGKHCAVVGATGGIGFAIAKAFANHGAVVSILGRSALDARHRLEPQLPPVSPLSPAAAAAAAAVPAEAAPLFPENSTTGATRSTHVPLTHRFLRLDVTNAEDIKTTFSSKDELRGVGHIDVLVNCAAVSQTTLLKRTPDEQLADILNTNLLSAMLICKHAKVQTNGCIINISSLMAIKGGLGATAYAASKSGLIGFTRALCREMSARSIRVNALLPGWVNTQMWTALKPELQQAYLKDTPLNRVAEPDEVADAAVFLASNGFANNCVLNLDGGLSAA